jgi:hypothetical protein
MKMRISPLKPYVISTVSHLRLEVASQHAKYPTNLKADEVRINPLRHSDNLHVFPAITEKRLTNPIDCCICQL